MARTRYPKQPRVGDVIEVGRYGLVVVIDVHDHGRRLYVTDDRGYVHHVERAENGCWWRPDDGGWVRDHGGE